MVSRRPLTVIAGGASEIPAGDALDLSTLAVRRSQLLLAVSSTLSGGIKGLIASGVVSPDPDDSSNVAYYHEPFALPGGALATLISTYLTTASASGGLGMTAPQAATQMTALFASAATKTLGT